MSSNKLRSLALKAIKRHPQVFEALAEYDRTRKYPQTVYRERINLTIDANLLRKFKSYARQKSINMSRLIEKHMLEEMKKKQAN